MRVLALQLPSCRWLKVNRLCRTILRLQSFDWAGWGLDWAGLGMGWSGNGHDLPNGRGNMLAQTVLPRAFTRFA